MQTFTIDVKDATSVRDAISRAIAYASAKGVIVNFVFNEVAVTAQPDAKFNDVLRNYFLAANNLSMEKYRRAANVNQLELDELVMRLPNIVGSTRSLLEWLASYTNVALKPDILDCRTAEVEKVLSHEGFYSNMYAGDQSAWADATKSGAFIVGKAMKSIEAGDPPHPVTVTFVEHWMETFCAATNSRKG